jgi:putative CocE/NonD family hydrolase
MRQSAMTGRCAVVRTVSLFSGLLFALCVHAQNVSDAIAPPPAAYEVEVQRGVMVPMRDQVHLATDLYRPKGLTGPLPVVLIRTPYNKLAYYSGPSRAQRGGSLRLAYTFAGQGYVVAVQDVRGKYESEGEYLASANDVNDGYDTVEWIAKQPWSNGKVGTIGCSYAGDVQVMAMKSKPPHLAATVPQAAGSSIGTAGERRRYLGARNGGAVELAASVAWFRDWGGSKIYLRPPANISREEYMAYAHYFDPAPLPPPIEYSDAFELLPIVDILKRVGAPPTDYESFVSHEMSDPWWEQFGYLTDSDSFDTASLQVNSWYDFGVEQTLYQFNLFRRNALSARARDNQFIIVSPTNHCRSEEATSHTLVGERDMGDARFDYYSVYLQWFGHWLKGEENHVTERPKIYLYVMGRNQWRAENEWPLARTQFTPYYLHSGGHANSRVGDGTLSDAAPRNEPADQYTYDPITPVPTTGGALGALKGPAEGPVNQSVVEMRNDVLVYTTPPLAKGIEVTGPLQLVLYVSSSARDTDFTAKLVDVYPDGSAYNLKEGILRARYREGFSKKVWMQPGGVYKVVVDLDATSNYFGP